jgi:type I restriction enzyme M protein
MRWVAPAEKDCTLWFLDRGKKKTPRADKVLFIDVRHIYRQIDRAHRDWSEAQIGFLARPCRERVPRG